jgi:hypothetical protein
MVTRASAAGVAPGELHAGQHQGRAAVGGGADLEQAQRVGHHGRGQHLVDGDLLAVAGVGVGQPVPGVLHLDLREVLLGGAEAVHAPPGVEGEVGRVGGPHQMEAQPVRVVLALAADRGEEALGRGVGADHQRHVAQPGQDLGPGVADGLPPPRRRRRSTLETRAPVHPGPGRRWPGDEARVAVADGVGARDELDVAPRRGRRRPGRRRRRPTRTRRRAPHLPHGCMPAPSTATFLSSASAQSPRSGAPAPWTGRHFHTR